MTQEENLGIGEQVLNRAAEIGLSSQLDDAENIDIDIQGDLLKLVQGEADSIILKGEGLVTSQDLRLEELELQTGTIAVNLISAVLGKVELAHPTNIAVRVVLTTADLNRALNSNVLSNQLRQLEFPVNNQVMTIELQQAECYLPGNGKLVLQGEILVHLADNTQAAAFSVGLRIRADGQYIAIEEGNYQQGKDLPLELTTALLVKSNELLHQRYFESEDVSISLKQLRVEKDKITLWLNAYAARIPS
ncbi:MAG: DUF2993 domain-containing protein [Cyanobacteriota bacterium]